MLCLWLRWCWESVFQTVMFYRGSSILAKLVRAISTSVCVAAANLSHQWLVAWQKRVALDRSFCCPGKSYCSEKAVVASYTVLIGPLNWMRKGSGVINWVKGKLVMGLLDGDCQATWWQKISAQETVPLDIPLFVSKWYVTEMSLDTSSVLKL